MSIYHKVCPGCAASVPRESEICDCGHSFVATDESTSTADEELYLNYLNARIDQLVTNVETARAALAERPSSFERALAVMRAVSALRTAREDIEAQESKIKALGASTSEEPGASSPTASGHEETAADHTDEPAASVFAEQSLDVVRSHAPGTAFRALQAARAAKVMSAASRECPNCRAANPPDVTHCACGYELAPVTLPDVGEATDGRPSRK